MLLALLPGLGVAAGGLIAETVPRSQRWLNWSLHGAAGIVIAIAAVEVFPGALDATSAWTIGIAFAAGGLAYLGAQVLIERRTASGDTRMWMIFLAVATDLFGDGLLIGGPSEAQRIAFFGPLRSHAVRRVGPSAKPGVRRTSGRRPRASHRPR